MAMRTAKSPRLGRQRIKFLVGTFGWNEQRKATGKIAPATTCLGALLWPESQGGKPFWIEEFNDENARIRAPVMRGGYTTEFIRKIWFDRAGGGGGGKTECRPCKSYGRERVTL